MAPNTGPKAKAQRRFGELLIPRPKYQRILEKRPYGPGQHGPEGQFRRSRQSSYGQQLLEKQKLAYVYNVRDRQLRRYFRIAAQQPGQTGENLLSLLERRLDNLVYRAGWAPTIWAARQLVSHGHILVDGKRVDIPSYIVEPGQHLALAAKMHQNPQVLQWLEEATAPPPYLEVDRVDHSAQLVQVPARADIPVPIDEVLVVEYYNRRM